MASSVPWFTIPYSSYQWSWLQDLPKWEVGIASGKGHQENFSNKKQKCQRAWHKIRGLFMYMVQRLEV